jgi:proteasome lid subunit RPN8/RPN11
MIRIEKGAWADMLAHAIATYPNECCGTMLGLQEAGVKRVTRAMALENAFGGPRASRYEVKPEQLMEVERLARREGVALIGIYHSHPDCEAYFSERDLRNSCPWYSFLVLSIRGGKFHDANSWLPDVEQTRAERETLSYPGLEEVLCQKY